MIEETKGYTLSVDTYKKAKVLGMKDPRYYIYASLRGSGMPMRDCWAIAFQGYGFNWPKETLEREMNKLESLESVQKRIAEVQGKKAKNENSEELTAEELAKATSKEQILKDLVLAQRKAKYGSPEWLKIVASIADYNKYGVKTFPARKGPKSVRYGTKWLQMLEAIVIDPERCPDTAKEFSEYEYERDAKTGEVLEGYPDINNHHIDAVRYAMESTAGKAGDAAEKPYKSILTQGW